MLAPTAVWLKYDVTDRRVATKVELLRHEHVQEGSAATAGEHSRCLRLSAPFPWGSHSL